MTPASPSGWRRVATVAAALAGVVLGVAGALCSGLFLWSALGALGEPDRAVVFWYAVFLVFGIALSSCGTLLLWLAARGRPGDTVVSEDVVRGCMWAVAVAGGLIAVAGAALALWHTVMIRAG